MLGTKRDSEGHLEFEKLSKSLNDEQVFAEYKAKFDDYRPGLAPRMIGKVLESCAHVVYGDKATYLMFRAIEVFARVPYQTWGSVMFTLLTLFFADEQRALRLSRLARFFSIAQENETMHVVVISHITRDERVGNVFTRTIIPMASAMSYYAVAYVMYVVSPKSAFELNYIFEQNALRHYTHFVALHAEKLKKKPVDSDFLRWYGRNPANQYEFFLSVRNDELIHRNRTIESMQ